MIVKQTDKQTNKQTSKQTNRPTNEQTLAGSPWDWQRQYPVFQPYRFARTIKNIKDFKDVGKRSRRDLSALWASWRASRAGWKNEYLKYGQKTSKQILILELLWRTEHFLTGLNSNNHCIIEMTPLSRETWYQQIQESLCRSCSAVEPVLSLWSGGTRNQPGNSIKLHQLLRTTMWSCWSKENVILQYWGRTSIESFSVAAVEGRPGLPQAEMNVAKPLIIAFWFLQIGEISLPVTNWHLTGRCQ